MIRENIMALEPYTCARDEFDGEEAIFLDANENPYDSGYNRYPDPRQRKLKAMLAPIKKVKESQMLIGNGSDEIIDLLERSICTPGKDSIAVFIPGYSMYEVCAAINDVEVVRIGLTREYLPDWQKLDEVIREKSIKMVFLCSPNNPTGKSIPEQDMLDFCEKFDGWVVVDEAYVDFGDQGSMSRYIEEYPNLVVMQTLSKAWGMAGLRLGICISSEGLISILNKVKYPYNVNVESQRIACRALADYDGFCRCVEEIKSERAKLAEALRQRSIFRKILEFDGNFLLVSLDEFKELYAYLAGNGVVVRRRDIPPLIPSSLRLTIGTEEENARLLELIDKFIAGER